MPPYPYSPWTSRPDRRFYGFSQQLDSYNFLHDGADMRFWEFCTSRGLDPDSCSPPADLMFDSRQEPRRQLKGPGIVQLSKSKAYWYLGDRAVAPEEMLAHNGWDISQLKLDTIHEPVEGLIDFLERCEAGEAGEDDPMIDGQVAQKKKKRETGGRCKTRYTSITDLGGNGMNVADLTSVVLPAVLSATMEDLFEFDAESIDEMPLGAMNADSSDTILDPHNLDVKVQVKEIEAVVKTLTKDYQVYGTTVLGEFSKLK